MGQCLNMITIREQLYDNDSGDDNDNDNDEYDNYDCINDNGTDDDYDIIMMMISRVITI